MNPLLTALAAAIFLLLPAPGFSAYIIHLKDGRQFMTEEYIEDGDQIKFKAYGGLIGIQKNLIHNIEETDKAAPEKQVVRTKAEPSKVDSETEVKDKAEDSAFEPADKAKAPPEDVGKSDERNDASSVEVSEKDKKTAEQEKHRRMQLILNEKWEIMRQLDQATASFKEAKASRDNARKSQYWNLILTLQKKLRELGKQAAAENGGKLPAWWGNQ